MRRLSGALNCAALSLALVLSAGGVAAAGLAIDTTELPAAPVGTGYEATIEASGAVGKVTWSAAKAPPGLTLDAAKGVLNGVPTTAGTYELSVTATDESKPPESVTSKLSLVVVFAIEPTELPAARVGTEYEVDFKANGAVGKVTWSLAKAPPGLTLDAATGVLKGWPTAGGSYALQVAATDESTLVEPVTRRLSLLVELALEANPIKLGDVHKAPAEKSFPILLTFPAEDAVKLENLVYSVRFVSGEGEDRREAKPESSVSGPDVREEGHVFTIEATVPPYEEIFGEASLQGWWPEKAAIEVSAGVAGETRWRRTVPFEVPRTGWGTFYGMVAIVGLFFAIIGLLKPQFRSDPRFDPSKDTRRKEWANKSQLARALQAPLRFCVTPIDTYSISLAQILFWTALVIFSSVYVAFVRGGFLEVTPQVLGLLGIGGGTAIAAKANAVMRSREIPKKYLERIKRDRVPQLSDLISTRGTPNIYKFQMFAFTLINGGIVLNGVYTGFGFPEIPPEQLTLMGVSSGVYLGNEMVVKNHWEEIERKIQEAEQLQGEGKESEYAKALEEIDEELLEAYS